MRDGDLRTLGGQLALIISKLPRAEASWILETEFGKGTVVSLYPEEDEYSYQGLCRRFGSDKVDEHNLVNLHDVVVGLSFQETPAEWEPHHFRLFMSHVTGDKARLAELKRSLSDYGIDAFLAHESIAPTAKWQTSIMASLQNCQALAAFLTPTFHDSLWTDQEVGVVLGRGELVFAINLGLTPYGFMGEAQALPALRLADNEIEEAIFDILVKHPQTARNMAEALVYRFEDSRSFAEVKRNLILLEKASGFTFAHMEILQHARQRNNQIAREAFADTPARIAALVQKYGSDAPFGG